MIPVEQSFAEWRKDPKYVEAYNALEDEFEFAAVMIRVRTSGMLRGTKNSRAAYIWANGGLLGGENRVENGIEVDRRHVGCIS
jgi:hypothetical protein